MRSCYTGTIKPFRDSDQTRKVIWYFTRSNAPDMPFSVAFGSQLWDRKEEPPLPVGEQFFPHPWRGGEAPFSVPVGGLCGTQDQWQNGCYLSDPVPANYPGSNVPQCCDPPIEQPLGGLALGALVTVTPGPNLCNSPPSPSDMCMTATWTGTGSPTVFPPWGSSPNYSTPVTLTGSGWTTGVFTIENPPGSVCGTLAAIMACMPLPFGWSIDITVTIPPCSGGFPTFALPQDNLVSIQLSPYELQFLNTTGPSAGWLFTLTENVDCPVVTDCCIGGIGGMRTLTISGGGLSGSITAYVVGGTKPTWTFASTTIVGCGGSLFECFISCGKDSSGNPVWQVSFQNPSCYHPGVPNQLYNATSVNCSLPSIVWAGLPGGVTLSMS